MASILDRLGSPTVPPVDQSRLDPFLNRVGAGAVSGLASLAELPLSLYGYADLAVQGYKGAQQPVLPGAQEANDIVQKTQEGIHKAFGVGMPETFGDKVTELLPQVVIPGGAMTKFVPKLLAPLVPFRQSTSGLGMAVEAGLPLAADQAATELLQHGGPVTDAVTGGVATISHKIASPTTSPTAVPPTDTPITPTVDNQPQPELDLSLIGEPIDYNQPIMDMSLFKPKSADVGRVDEQLGIAPWQDHNYDYAKMAVGSVLAGLTVLGVKAGVESTIAARKAKAAGGQYGGNQTQEPNNQIQGQSSEKIESLLGPITTPGVLAKTQMLDKNAPISATLDRLHPQMKDHFEARMQTLNMQAISAMTDDFYKTGRFPGSKYKVDTPVIETLQKASQLSNDERNAFEQIATLGTKYDQSVRAKFSGWGSGRNKVSHTTISADLLSYRTRFPRAAKLVDELNTTFKKVPEFLEEQGWIDYATKQELLNANPHYVPTRVEHVNGISQQLKDFLFPSSSMSRSGLSTEIPWFNERMDIAKGQGLQPGQVGSVMYSTPQYFDDLIRAVMVNKFRADLIQAGSSIRVNGEKLFKIRSSNYAPQDGSPHIQVRINGAARWVKVKDPGVLSAMRWRPRTAWQLAAQSNNFASKFITGKFNPLFLGKHIQYETMSAIPNLPTGRKLGMLNSVVSTTGDFATVAGLPTVGKLLKTLGVKANLSSFDPTNLVVAPVGGFRALWGDLSYSAYMKAKTDLFNNSWLTKTFGSQNVDTFARMMKDAYERSTASLAEHVGATGEGRYAAISSNQQFSAALDHVAGYSQAKGYSIRTQLPVSIYNHLYDAVRDGVRLQYISANTEREFRVRRYSFTIGGKNVTVPVFAYEPKGTPHDLAKLGSETRNLTGDAARIGGDTATRWGSLNQKGWSAVMYGNQSLQALAQMGRMMKDHPVRFATAASGIVSAHVAAVLYAAQTEAGRELLNQLTPEQRARNTPIVDEEGNLKAFMNLPPEFRPIVAAADQMVLSALGIIHGGQDEGVKDVGRSAWLSLRSDFLPDVLSSPLISGIAAGAFGIDWRTPNSLTGSQIKPSEVENLMDPDYQGSMGETLKNIIDAAIGGTMTMAVDSVGNLMSAMHYNQGAPEKYQLNPFTVATEGLLGPMQESKTAGIFAPLWGISPSVSKTNLTARKIQDVVPKLDEIITRGAKTVATGGAAFSTKQHQLQDPTNLVPNEQNTRFALVYQGAKALRSTLMPLQTKYKTLTNREQQVTVDPHYADYHKRLPVLNDLAKQKLTLNEDMLGYIREAERLLSLRLGNEFSFDTFSGNQP